MSPSTQSSLLASLGLAVFERAGEGSFQWLGGASAWLPGGYLMDAFPFLEVFLPDAEAFWADPQNQPSLSSDVWTETAADGSELHFCAIAVKADRKLLVIERIGERFEQKRAFVQYAHEAKLAQERIAKLSEELRRATEAKSEFLAHMSHEIRTPMNGLLGMAELLSETPLNAEQSEYVRIFRRAGENLLHVINDILDFSKVEAGLLELENITFDLAEVVQEAIEIIAVRAREKGLSLTHEIASDVPARLIGDPGRLRQILLNLLGNAVKFTERGGIRVLVKPDSASDSLHFAVTDSGVGIPADRVSTIFDSFSQADSSTTRKYGGTGLGLAISKRFVELMGGHIWAESTPGEGSIIHFTARFGTAKSSDVKTPIKKQDWTLANRRLRILLADDSEDNRFLVRGYLKETGCVLDEVENGAEALTKFEQRTYDVVLLDAQMPVLDGYSATRAMRTFEQERSKRSTPILVLTADAFKEARDRSIAAGCTDHLTKPISKSALTGAIARNLPDKPAGRIQLAVESWLKPVIPQYLARRRADVAKLRTALEQKDFPTIRTLGHQMGGNGASYGFAEISEIGATLEESALAGDAEKIESAIAMLDLYLNNIEL